MFDTSLTIGANKNPICIRFRGLMRSKACKLTVSTAVLLGRKQQYSVDNHICSNVSVDNTGLVKVDIMFVSWQIIEHIFFQIINHHILIAMVTNTRLISMGTSQFNTLINIVIVNTKILKQKISSFHIIGYIVFMKVSEKQ